MRWTWWVCLLVLFFPGQGVVHGQVLPLEQLRRFAQEELDGPDVKFKKPAVEIKNEKLLHHFEFGEIKAAVDGALLLQLRVELLRRYPVFGEKALRQALPQLEAVIADIHGLEKVKAKFPPPKVGDAPELSKKRDEVSRRLVALQIEFNDLLIDLAVLSAADKQLAISPRYAFRWRGPYYCAGRLIDRDKATFADIKKGVEDYFVRDVLAYLRPYKSMTRNPIAGVNTMTFNIGRILDLPSNLIIADMFYLELMRRHPVISQTAMQKHLPLIEANLRKQFEADPMGVSFRPGGTFKRGESYLFLIGAAFRETAKEVGHVYALNDGLGDEIIIGTGMEPLPAMIRTDVKVSKVTVIPALTYRLATRSKAPVSPLDTKTVQNGQRPYLKVGAYVYQLEFADGTTGPFRSFRIPEDIDQQGVLMLR